MATVKNFVFSQKVFLTNLAATLILLLMFLMALFSSYLVIRATRP